MVPNRAKLSKFDLPQLKRKQVKLEFTQLRVTLSRATSTVVLSREILHQKNPENQVQKQSSGGVL